MTKCKVKFGKIYEAKKYSQDAIDVFPSLYQDTYATFNSGDTCVLALYSATTSINSLNVFHYNCLITETRKQN